MKKILLTAAAVAVLSAPSVYAMEDTFYIKANAGWSKLDKNDGAKSNNAAFVALGVGYYIMDNVRADLTLDHFINSEFKNSDLAGSKAKVNVNTLMANGYVDLFDVSVAKVFVGAGVGVARVGGKITGLPVAVKFKTANNFTYAAHLGASAEFAPGVNGELVYSYRNFGKTKTKVVELKTKDFKGHHVSAGVRFDI